MDLRRLASPTLFYAILALLAASPLTADIGMAPLAARYDLAPPPSSGQAAFGTAVAVSRDGSTALVGSSEGFCLGRPTTCGGVFAFRRGAAGWVFEAVLPLTELGNAWWRAVALSGDGNVAVLGSLQSGRCEMPCSAVSFYRRGPSGWQREAVVDNPDTIPFYEFGQAVAISDDGGTAVVADPSEFCGPLTCGAAYVYEESGGVWTATARLAVPDSTFGTLGQGLALTADGSRLLLGAPSTSLGCPSGVGNCGRVYVFDESGGSWSLSGEIAPPVPESRASWGRRIAVDASGRLAVIGAAAFDCAVGASCGAVEVFADTGGGAWSLEARFVGSPGDELGHSLALSADGTEALAGAPGAAECGEALLFASAGGTWRPAARQAVPDAGRFGHAVALDGAGRVAVVGAPETPCAQPIPFASTGAAFAFEDLALTAVPTAGETALGLLALGLAAAGTFLLRRV
jgi:hypothetical protein